MAKFISKNDSQSVNKRPLEMFLVIFSVLTLSLVTVNLAISILTNINMPESLTNIIQENIDHINNSNISLNQQFVNLSTDGQSSLNIFSKQVIYKQANNKIKLKGSIGNKINYSDYESIITKSFTLNKHLIQFNAISRAANIELTLNTYYDQNGITCNDYEWKIVKNWTNPAFQEFEDCFSLTDASWYGGSEVADQQYWPINKQDFGSYKPYLSGVFAKSSAVLERYWFSTAGVAITVSFNSPLFVLKNTSNICILGSSQKPYNYSRDSSLSYSICHIEPTGTDYINKLHLFMINKYFAKPSSIPDELMFKRPIWSTWAVFKKFIDEKKVHDFAQEINAYNYSNCQLEIDDKWQTLYGDFTFDDSKFPNMRSFIQSINDLGFRTTLWMHPFLNIDAKNLLKWSLNFYAVRANEGISLPLLTSWWDGYVSLILDATNTNATKYFINELENIRNTTGIDSFKFDAGEFEWLPKNGYLTNAKETPEQFCSDYARMAAKLGPMIEIRVGCRTQDLPVFVRMIDRDSKWGMDNGLKSVITATLAFSVMGYPFVLPDMIGGNAYFFINGNIDFDTQEIAFPDHELFIRWTQVNAFLPAMQFSIPPWYYNNRTTVEVNKICKKYVDLHESLVFPILKKYAKLATETGEPIIRALWWVDNSDSNTYLIDDQFLVGNDILVAPIVDENTYQRDIYLPLGSWIYTNGTEYKGPTRLTSFPAPIDILPYFIKKI